jgi:hypothetical protein
MRVESLATETRSVIRESLAALRTYAECERRLANTLRHCGRIPSAERAEAEAAKLDGYCEGMERRIKAWELSSQPPSSSSAPWSP